jgi:hypothetical protein
MREEAGKRDIIPAGSVPVGSRIPADLPETVPAALARKLLVLRRRAPAAHDEDQLP